MTDPTPTRDPFPELTAEWSRPRKIGRVLYLLGLDVPMRLRHERFVEMLGELAALNIEAQGPDGEVLTEDSASPGINSKLRLRRVKGRARARRGKPGAAPSAVLRKVTLQNFKSFASASLPLAELTVLIGANASGKSNALEALQLLCWAASGRRLGDVRFAVKEGELALRGNPTDLLWKPAGGKPGASTILGCELAPAKDASSLELDLEISADEEGLRVRNEELRCPEESPSMPLYKVIKPARKHGREMTVEYNNFSRGGNKPQIACVDEQPVFVQLTSPARFAAGHERAQELIPAAATRLRQALESILFLDPSPRQMRSYSFRGDKGLFGDGSNLSAVLHELTENRGARDEILDFIRSIPEQDILGIDYLEGPRGEVMVRLTESFGGAQTAREAVLLSDGTLRVLAIAAALLSVREGALVVIEEIDNGVHPSRAADLLSRIQELATRRHLRVLITTHNPALLDSLPDQALPNVVACYRDPKNGSSRLVRLSELPSYPELVARGPLGRLLTQGIVDRFLKSPQDPAKKRERDLAWVDRIFGEDE